jgi:hypothetical protein
MSVSGNAMIVADENYQGSPEEAKAINDFEAKRKESRKNPEKHNFHQIDDFYYKSPILSTAEDILRGFKEGLIEKIVIMSSYRKAIGKGQGG